MILSQWKYKKLEDPFLTLAAIFICFFLLFSERVSHFAADASGITGVETAAINASLQEPSSQREPQHTAAVECLTTVSDNILK